MKSSRAFLPSPVIEVAGSCRIRLGICCGIGLALAAISLATLSWPLRVLVICLVLLNGLWELWCVWPGVNGALRRLRVTDDGRLMCGFAPDTGVLVAATVRHWWTVGDRVTGLVVERHGKRCSRAILFRDLLAPDQWRRLNVCLRFTRAHPDGLT